MLICGGLQGYNSVILLAFASPAAKSALKYAPQILKLYGPQTMETPDLKAHVLTRAGSHDFTYCKPGQGAEEQKQRRCSVPLCRRLVRSTQDLENHNPEQ